MERQRADRFWAKVNKAGPIPTYAPHLGPCWLWTGALNGGTGYGSFSLGYRRANGSPASGLAHRVAYAIQRGAIPKGLTIDHLCRVRHCVRPTHLEATSMKTNILRGTGITAREAKRTHCPQGHPYNTANTRLYRGWRTCRTCRAEYKKRWRDKRRAMGLPVS